MRMVSSRSLTRSGPSSSTPRPTWPSSTTSPTSPDRWPGTSVTASSNGPRTARISTSTSSPSSPLEQALAGVPQQFRKKLISAYLDLKKAVSERDPDTAGLKVGKFCEICLRLLQQVVIGSFTPFGKKIDNFADDCRKIIT